MVIARNLTHLRPVATCAGEDCLRIPVTCPCGATVAAGDGHDCSKPWGGYWLCECGHCTRHHNAWWDDMNGQSGMGCDVCDCGNPEEVT